MCSLLEARLSTVNVEHLQQKENVSALNIISKCVTCGCSCLFYLDVNTEMHLFCEISHPVDILMQNHKLFDSFFSKLCY
jgi:hypothetical protein